MVKEITEYTIFISCPEELKPEKNLVKEICENLTTGFGSMYGIRFKPIDFKKDIASLITGEGAQSVINQQLEDYDYDIYIGILWKHFGEIGDNGKTPTEEEFEIAYERFRTTGRPQIQFYFKSETLPAKSAYEAKQAWQVLEFKEKRIMPLGIYTDFLDENEFSSKILQSLPQLIQKIEKTKQPSASTTETQKIKYDEVPNYLERKVYLTKDYSSANKFLARDGFAVDLLSVVEKEKRIVLLGDAGTGKTTELFRIASYYSKEEENLYPIFISLNKYVRNLSELLPSNWTKIPESQLLLLLDGLDDIESKNRNDAIREIELFVEQHPASHVIITCRTNFYNPETQQSIGTLVNFSSYTLLDLERKAIEEYIKRRFEE